MLMTSDPPLQSSRNILSWTSPSLCRLEDIVPAWKGAVSSDEHSMPREPALVRHLLVLGALIPLLLPIAGWRCPVCWFSDSSSRLFPGTASCHYHPSSLSFSLSVPTCFLQSLSPFLPFCVPTLCLKGSAPLCLPLPLIQALIFYMA